ncbi:PaaI family thioesterase [Micrococcoides hystricis]|uniref:PaaI family thioesterase n=1 Tax=Micrococcoides hystricis TaxID=1572761 RepID=A0ABV6P7A8_9MICC
MSIWHGEWTPEELNKRGDACLNENLGIEILELTENSIRGRMPVDARTIQPAGVLHGGASVVLAETLASWGGFLSVDQSKYHAVGLEINANHMRPVPAGEWVYGEATPAHRGRSTQIWEIRITNEAGKLVCLSRCTIAIIEVPAQYQSADQRA